MSEFQENYQLTIFYTTDLHGKIILDDQTSNFLSLPKILKECKNDYLLLDNGDNLQGSPFMDTWLKHQNQLSITALAFNDLKYDVVNIGNHDFNYGLETLENFVKQLDCPCLCANVLKNRQPLYQPFIIKTLPNGIKIGIIGLVTQYIPNFEKPSNIEGLTFEEADVCLTKYINKLKPLVNAIIVLYHGGYEKDLNTLNNLGRPTLENLGYKMLENGNFDVLLTGHQHLTIEPLIINNVLTMQSSYDGKMVGKIDLFFQKHKTWQLVDKQGLLLPLENEKIDTTNNKPLFNIYDQTIKYLTLPLQNLRTSAFLINDPFLERLKLNPLFHLVGKVLFDLSKADVCIVSLANQCNGLKEKTSIKDIINNFPYPNNYYLLKMRFSDLKIAMEQSSTYFTCESNQIVINPAFCVPKLEHYNYDVFYGLVYTINVDKPIGQRITEVYLNNRLLKADDIITVCLNNYRAVGGGDYEIYKKQEVIKIYNEDIQTLLINYLQNHLPNLNDYHNFITYKINNSQKL